MLVTVPAQMSVSYCVLSALTCLSSACCDSVTDGVGREGSALLWVPELTPDLETGGALHRRPPQPVGQPVCEQGPHVVGASRLSEDNTKVCHPGRPAGIGVLRCPAGDRSRGVAEDCNSESSGARQVPGALGGLQWADGGRRVAQSREDRGWTRRRRGQRRRPCGWRALLGKAPESPRLWGEGRTLSVLREAAGVGSGAGDKHEGDPQSSALSSCDAAVSTRHRPAVRGAGSFAAETVSASAGDAAWPPGADSTSTRGPEAGAQRWEWPTGPSPPGAVTAACSGGGVASSWRQTVS